MENSVSFKKISSKRVDYIFKDCLDKNVKHNTILNTFVDNIKLVFDKNKLNEYSNEIYFMLKELPEEFINGISIIEACYDRNGVQWAAFQFVAEQLIELGIAIGKVSGPIITNDKESYFMNNDKIYILSA